MIYDSQTRKYDVVVLGAGAAGLMTGLTAGFRGRSVLILERSNMVGKKILMSGGGRCNFTNQYVDSENFLSENSRFCIGALNSYTADDFIQMVDRHNIQYEVRKNNQLFCVNSSSDILEMLLTECALANVEIETHSDVDRISCLGPHNQIGKDDLYRYVLNSNKNGKRVGNRSDKISCKSLVVASGGLSIPTLGGSGFGYELATKFSLNVTDLYAGLVPFTFSGDLHSMVKRLSGVSTYAGVTCNGKTFREHILFTHRGLSGPAILQISNYWAAGQPITINFFPDQNVVAQLLKQKETQSQIFIKTFLSRFLPRSLVNELQTIWWPNFSRTPICKVPDKSLLLIGNKLSKWNLIPAGTEGYRTAEVTGGGVSTEKISSKTMEVKGQPGLYFVGEVLDITGHLVGFNFQWAWSSGYAAGLYA
ncbi:MAG TPA: NAD(P)/FAD-dependent oxidoreductase [Dehalococcoidia bacterium]|nr:NAD(P)/FAD-dependent oxidoreductase [Dehalococcoidia bacterium]